jgi:hypothetical protein
VRCSACDTPRTFLAFRASFWRAEIETTRTRNLQKFSFSIYFNPSTMMVKMHGLKDLKSVGSFYVQRIDILLRLALLADPTKIDVSKPVPEKLKFCHQN